MSFMDSLAQLLFDSQFPGWYPFISYTDLTQQRSEWLESSVYSIEANHVNESNFALPLSKRIVARVGHNFWTSRYEGNVDNFLNENGYCIFFLWYFHDQYWRELAQKERNYRLEVLLGIPKPETPVHRFRNSPLYEQNLWRVILAYADVPERFQ